jgi:hypothetical protein
MNSAIQEALPKRLFTPVAPSLLHEYQFNILLIQSQQKKDAPQSPRRHSSSEKNNKIRAKK